MTATFEPPAMTLLLPETPVLGPPLGVGSCPGCCVATPPTPYERLVMKLETGAAGTGGVGVVVLLPQRIARTAQVIVPNQSQNRCRPRIASVCADPRDRLTASLPDTLRGDSAGL